ncbi:hypothetical protein ACRALDRAFT_1061500, partial [Sodiomyces alcalophilus JCM 7366]|uniref:uncharacterized protein n=1 Tax=Sodiomyces alcalophilus JCM 7366 TaxID=591952 RepID=UPI0039B53C9E
MTEPNTPGNASMEETNVDWAESSTPGKASTEETDVDGAESNTPGNASTEETSVDWAEFDGNAAPQVAIAEEPQVVNPHGIEPHVEPPVPAN